MEVTSLYFAILVIISIFLFYLIKSRYRIAFLTLLSLGFIATFGLNLLIYVVSFSTINFTLGLIMSYTKKKSAILRTGIALNILQLIVLKYSTFAIDPVLRIFSNSFSVSGVADIIVPIGISYFTLQGIGYLINLKMGWETPEKNYFNFLLYIVFFPKFMSGPVERSNHFLPQLRSTPSFDQLKVASGLRLILVGFIKKDVVANQLSLFINPIYNDIDASWGWILILVILIQPLYLYFDFSGYTDIALGIAKTYGLQLLPNFDRPFFSENVSTFWRRFHMSLSSWFNDYVFKQTSFKLRKWKTHASPIAVLITWLLFGIWHGAGWHFMILGLFQALAINYEFLSRKKRASFFSKFPYQLRMWTGRFVTYLFFGISLVFFFSPNLNSAIKFFSGLYKMSSSARIGIPDKSAFFSAFFIMLIILIIEFLSIDHKGIFDRLRSKWNGNSRSCSIIRWTLYYLMILTVFYLGGLHVEFIYFQF